MKDVRIILGKTFEALMAISKDHNLKATTLPNDELNALRSDLAKLNELVVEASVRAEGHQVITLYAIGKESAPGEYDGFTHGPTPDRDELKNVGSLEDGDCLVRMVSVGGIQNNVTEAIWLDDEWNETGDELKAGTA